MGRDLIYESLIRPLLFKMDPEEAHDFVHSLLKLPLSPLGLSQCKYSQTDLVSRFFDTQMSNPIGLAAGFDKNASLLPVLQNLGFGFVEIGSVCARPHGGNDRPRLFRLPQDNALINRLGLNGLGVEVVANRLETAKLALPIGINIAKTNDPSLIGKDAAADILYTFTRMRDLPVAYFTINVSCPNTKEGCIKESDLIASVLEQVQAENIHNKPVLVKLSADSSDDFIRQIVAIAKDNNMAGYVCGNTTTNRDNLLTSAERLNAIGQGGLSGVPLKRLNLELCRKIYRHKQANQIIIGVGGIASGDDAYEYICAGASLVQLYTALVYKGPTAVKQICEELAAILQKKAKPLQDLVGSATH